VYGPQIDRTLVDTKRKLFQEYVELWLEQYATVKLDAHLWDLDPKKNADHAKAEIEIFRLFFKQIVPVMTEQDSDILAYLLTDYGIFAYAFLRWENRAFRVRYYQDVIMCDSARFKYIEGSNQDGKSMTLCIESCIDYMRDHGKNFTILLISKSQNQNGINMRRIKQILHDADIHISDPGGHDSMMVTTRRTKDGYVNTLVCSVAGASGLGFPANRVRLDEFEFWPEEEGKTQRWYWDQVFVPRTFATGGSVEGYCNPNGKNFVSEDLQKRKDKHGNYLVHTYNFNYLDNPENDKEFYEQQKAVVHPIIFSSTMAATRTESEGSALTDADIQKTKSEDLDNLGFLGVNKDESYWFLDLGFVYDQSALCACYVTKNEKGESVYNFPVHVFPQQHPHTQMWGIESSDEPSVPQLVKRFGGDGAVFELDLTGKEGNEINANNAGLNCVGVKMSGPWKAKWYDRFISLVKQNRIRVQQIENWIDGSNKNFEFQARSLKMSTKTSDGRNRPYPLYHHTNEKDHDDIVDCIVGCLSLVDQDMSDGDSYDMALTVYDKDKKADVPTFEEYIKTVEVPRFLKLDELRAWYEKRHGLRL
jgi:hypothetical protein